MKKCSKCKEIKDYSFFQKDKTKKDGFYSSCKSCKKVYNDNNRNEINKRQSIYYYNNKQKCIKCNNLCVSKRRKIDPVFRLKTNLQSYFNQIYRKRGYNKGSRTHEILGCSYDFFRNYIESQFKSWMCWENYGKYNGELNYGWDLDHIIPMSVAKDEESVKKLNHYSNFQPLDSKINRDIKINKINHE